jgi:hypothetical protein
MKFVLRAAAAVAAAVMMGGFGRMGSALRRYRLARAM